MVCHFPYYGSDFDDMEGLEEVARFEDQEIIAGRTKYLCQCPLKIATSERRDNKHILIRFCFDLGALRIYIGGGGVTSLVLKGGKIDSFCLNDCRPSQCLTG